MKQKFFRAQFASFEQKLQNWFSSSDNNQPVQGSMLETWFYVLAALVLISLISGIIAFSKPAFRVVNDDVQFQHVGFFSYSAPAPQGVYDSNAIQSGDPIFPKLTCSVDVSFQYTFIAQTDASIAGTHQLIATISETASSWRRVVPLEEVMTFSGNVFGAATKLNLCQIEGLIQSMEEETGFHAGSYLLTISPNIHIIGNIGGNALESEFDPSLTFSYDRVHFYATQGSEEGHPFNPTETGTTGGEHQTANTILFFGMEIAVPALRWFSVIVLLGSLAGVVFFGMKMQELSKQDQSRFIRMKYKSMMVDVHQTMLVNKADIVDVASIDDLAKLAEKFSTMILHTEGSALHSYYVRDNGATYRFMLPVETGAAVPDATREAQS
jgi:hypothetical protein